MSHFSTVKTELRQIEPLVQALEDLGLSPEKGQRPVRGYRGQTVTADLAVSMDCLLYTSPSPRDKRQSRMPSSA